MPSAARASLVAATALALCRPAAAAGETDLVKAALAQGGFKAFVGLVSRAGLADTLGQSPVTVFMPTDAAFARLSAAQRKSIADLSPDGVRAFVGRFVFPGTAMASNDIDKTITSASGTAFDVTWFKGRLSLRDDRGPATSRLAYVVQGDIPAGAGMIDAVDAVLMPVGSGGMAIPVADGGSTVATSPDARPPATPGTAAPTPAAAPATSPPPGAAIPTAASAPTMSPDPAAAPSPGVSFGSPPAKTAMVSPPPTSPAPSPSGTAPTLTISVPVTPPTPQVNVPAAGLQAWPLKISGNGSTGRIDRVLLGLPGGRIAGVTAHFGGFLGFGGRDVYVGWDRITPDTKAHVLRARLTTAEFTAAPAHPPGP